MRKVLICIVMCPLLTSCYAFLQADRLVYAGTVAKKTASAIQIDTVTVEVQNETETNVVK